MHRNFVSIRDVRVAVFAFSYLSARIWAEYWEVNEWLVRTVRTQLDAKDSSEWGRRRDSFAETVIDISEN